MKKKQLSALFLAGAFATLGASVATGAETGAELAWKYHCISCHGERGKSNQSRYPNIAGQNAAYLDARLKYFRSREEPGNQMNAQAAPLSNDDIALLADHFSQMQR